MISRSAASCAVLLAAATALVSAASGAGGDVRINLLSATPRPPQAGKSFELVARVEFAPAPGSIHSSVWIGGKRFRNMRLTWENSIARCSFAVPAAARGKRLTVGLSATLGVSRAQMMLTYVVA